MERRWRAVRAEHLTMERALLDTTPERRGTERRIGSRVPAIGVPAGRLVRSGRVASRDAACWMLDISVTGCCLLMHADPTLDAGTEARLVIDGIGFDVAVTVRRVDGADGRGPLLVGLEFAGDSPDALALFGGIADLLSGVALLPWELDRAQNADV
jgi:hypothetical protein